MTTTLMAPVALTPSAVNELKRLQTLETDPIKRLRVGVKGGGCSGLTYVLEWDTPTEHDLHFALDGLDVVLDKRHQLYLQGMTLDYQDGLNARGFVFQNPNAKTTCGCGTSFAA